MTRPRASIVALVSLIACAVLLPVPAAALTEQDAHTLVREGRHREAVAAFERLYARRPEPRLLLNIAAIYTLYMPGRCPDALGALDRFLIVCADCALRGEGESLQARARRTCVGQITIETAPSGARIRVDDGPEALAPATVELVEGAHVISVAAPGHRAAERSIVVRGGEPDTLRVELRPLEDPAERLFDRGRTLVDEGQPAAALAAFSEGEELEGSARFALEVARAALTLGDCPRAGAALERFDGRCPDCPLRAQASPSRISHQALCAPPAAADGISPWVWSGAAVGAVGVTFGALFHRQYVTGIDARDAARDRGESIVTLQALHDDAALDYQLMQVGYVVGGLGLVGAGLAWWLDDRDASTAAIRLTPRGLGIGATF